MMHFSSPSDMAFAEDDATRFLPKIIALVMVLVTLMLMCGLSLGSTLEGRASAESDKILVHIPAAKDQQETTDKTLSVLKKSTLVSRVEVVDNHQLQAQLKPWLGDLAEFDTLPMPRVIRMSWRAGTTQDISKLETLLKAINRDIQIDSRHQWAEKYAQFVALFKWVLTLLAAGLLAAVAALLMFAATTSLNLHQRTVTLLHHIGAHDDYIIRQFQSYAATMAFKGAMLGSLIALMLYVLLGFYVRSLHVALLPEFSLAWWHIALVLLLPLAAGCIGFVTARYATIHYLQRFL